MIEQPTVQPQTAESGDQHWSERFGKSIIFVILTLVAAGIYLAFTIPIAVFPETNFPRIVVGVDNGVAPIDQMLVIVTRPIEEACEHGARPGSRPIHHQPRIGGNRSVLLLESGHVPDARTGERRAGACAIRVASHGQGHLQPSHVRGVSDLGLQLDLGQRLADGAVGAGHLRAEASHQSPERE